MSGTGTLIAQVWPIAPRVVAQVLGLPYAQYRPSGAGPPLDAGNLVRTLPVWITADPRGEAIKPFAYGKPVGYGWFDPALAQVGDYLVGSMTLAGAASQFFIASMDIPQPIQVVQCNRILKIGQPYDPPTGPTFYSGDTAVDEAPLGTGWPAAVTAKGRRQGGETKLPGDMDLPWYEVLLPASFPTQLRPMDVLLDDQPQPLRYVLSSVEQTGLGWRCEARVTVA